MESPLGYTFQPRPRHMVEYLLSRVTGKPLPPNPMPNPMIEIEGDPKIWTKFSLNIGMRPLYFFTKLKGKGKRVSRASELGTWKAQKNFKVFDDDEEKRHIGSKRTFTFVAKKGFSPSARFTMHEYRLDGIYGNIPNNDNYVVCQINKYKRQDVATSENVEQDEDLEACYNSLFPHETPHLDFSD